MDFVKSAICADIRLDGRALDQPYELSVLPNISASSHGSSQVRFGDNVVQTTVHFSIVAPEDSAPDEGLIELSICGTNVFDNPELSQRNYELLCNILFDVQFNHPFLDLKSLCILAGHFCWSIRIHLTVVKHGGSLIDALSIGVVSALRCSEMPSVSVMLRDELESISDSSNLQIKLGTEKCVFFSDFVSRLPLITSVGKLGSRFLWSLTRDEEFCSQGSLVVAVDSSGRCLALKSRGSCFDLNSINSLVSKCSEIALDNFNLLNQHLNRF